MGLAPNEYLQGILIFIFISYSTVHQQIPVHLYLCLEHSSSSSLFLTWEPSSLIQFTAEVF